jgi:putative oxidoreductase
MSKSVHIYHENWPDTIVLLLGRFALASVFWLSGQTKVEGFALDLIHGQLTFGWPVLKDSTIFLFEHEYALPLLPPALAAYMATLAEHILPILLLLGLATRVAAIGIFTMTMVIQIFVYPNAYAVHATWLTISILLIFRGPGRISIDHLLFSFFSATGSK